MWRINNILLLVVLVAVILLGSLAIYQAASWQISESRSAASDKKNALPAGQVRDDDGELISTKIVSVGEPIEHPGWEEWYVLPVGQMNRDEPATADSDTYLLAAGSARSYGRRHPHVNNFALLSHAFEGERLLFDRKVAVQAYLPIGKDGVGGLAIAYADADTNQDGALDGKDEIRVSLFDFGNPQEIPAPFEGFFQEFASRRDATPSVWFLAGVDLDGDDRLDGNHEPTRVYEISLEGGGTRPAISDALVARAQSIVDGAAGSQ